MVPDSTRQDGEQLSLNLCRISRQSIFRGTSTCMTRTSNLTPFAVLGGQSANMPHPGITATARDDGMVGYQWPRVPLPT